MTDEVTLHPSHPYLRHAVVSVHPINGRWRVVWRDLLSVKQDAEFSTERQARQYAAKVRARLAIVPQEALADCCMTVADATEFWAALDV